MTVQGKNYLIDLIAESHSALRDVISVVDPNMQVYTGDSSGEVWRVRDILGHIATWDNVVAVSLRAYQDGTTYLIPNWDADEDLFNQQAVIDQRELTTEQVVAQWEQSYEEFKSAVQTLPDDKFPGDLLYPWGDEKGTIAGLIKYMTDHALEHRDEIVKAAQETYK